MNQRYLPCVKDLWKSGLPLFFDQYENAYYPVPDNLAELAAGIAVPNSRVFCAARPSKRTIEWNLVDASTGQTDVRVDDLPTQNPQQGKQYFINALRNMSSVPGTAIAGEVVSVTVDRRSKHVTMVVIADITSGCFVNNAFLPS